MLLAYEISGDTSYKCVECTQEEAEVLQSQGYFISEVPIIFKGEGAKMFVDGVLQDRPVIPPLDPPEPTIDEMIAEIEIKYQFKFDALDKILSRIILADGTDQETKIDDLRVSYQSISNEKDLEITQILGGAK